MDQSMTKNCGFLGKVMAMSKKESILDALFILTVIGLGLFSILLCCAVTTGVVKWAWGLF